MGMEAWVEAFRERNGGWVEKREGRGRGRERERRKGERGRR